MKRHALLMLHTLWISYSLAIEPSCFDLERRIGLEFSPLQSEQRREIDSLNEISQPELSPSSFTSLWAFANAYTPMVARIGEKLIVHLKNARPKDRNTFVEPLGGTPEERADQIRKSLTAHPVSEGKPNIFLGVSEEVAAKLKEDPTLVVKEIAEKQEYVYPSRDLATLKGKKLDAQRSQVVRFFEMFPEKGENPRSRYVELEKLTQREWLALVPQLKAFVQEWKKDRKGSERKDFNEELEAVNKMIDNFKSMDLKGAALLVDGKIVGFTFGKQLNNDTSVVYTEKALTELGGVKIDAYKALAHRFARSNMKDSLQKNGSPEAKRVLEKMALHESLEGLENLPQAAQREALLNNRLLEPAYLDGLLTLGDALKVSRGLDLPKAETDPKLMKIWESIKVRELANKVARGEPTANALAQVQAVFRAQIYNDLHQVPGELIRFINRQEDGGEVIHQTPKKQLNPLSDKGKSYAVQSRSVPELDWNIYESEK